MPLSNIPLKGEHNVENVLAAVCAARLAGALRNRAQSSSSRQWSIASNMWPRSMALKSITIPRPPTWMQLPRLLPHFPAIFTSSSAAKTRTPITPSCLNCCARGSAVYTIGSAAAKIESQLRGVVTIHSCETLDKAVERSGRRTSWRRGAARARLLQL